MMCPTYYIFLLHYITEFCIQSCYIFSGGFSNMDSIFYAQFTGRIIVESTATVKGPPISDSAHATPIVAAQLRLRRHNSLCLPSPRHQPRCTHLPTYCTVLSHTHLAYIVVTPSRVFLRVFSLDFPLLG